MRDVGGMVMILGPPNTAMGLKCVLVFVFAPSAVEERMMRASNGGDVLVWT